MLQGAATPVIFAHVMLWTFYCTPSCLSFNPDYILRFEKYQRKLNFGAEVYGSKSIYHDRSSENKNKLQSDHVNTIRTNINRNVSYPKTKYSKRRQLVFSPVKLIKLDSIRPKDSLHRLTRRRRSTSSDIPSNTTDSEIHGDTTDPASSDHGYAISKAVTNTGNAFAGSYAPGSGISKAETHAKNGGIAISLAQSLENNSTALATSEGGGHALSASESGRSGNAISTSISDGNGTSKAVASALEGRLVATVIHEDMASDTSHTNEYPPLRPAQYISNTEIDFDDPFFRPGFKTTPKPISVKTTPFNLGPTSSTPKHDALYSTTELYIPPSTTDVYIPPSTAENQDKNMTVQISRPFGDVQLNTSKKQTPSKHAQFDIHSPTTKLDISPSIKVDILQSRRHIQFHKGDYKRSYLIFESNPTSKCNNVPRQLLHEWNFVKTDTCIMVYNNYNCKSFTNKRFEPGTSSSQDFLIYSFHICNENEGGHQLNLDFTEYFSGYGKIPRILKSYKDVCQCINIPISVQGRQYWSINNHGNEMIAYYENDCKNTFAEPSYIPGGHSYESRNMYYLEKTRRKVESVGPAKNSTYFKSSCLKMSSVTPPSVVISD